MKAARHLGFRLSTHGALRRLANVDDVTWLSVP
jgi:hypothetical protein